jgi:hypothetical protein
MGHAFVVGGVFGYLYYRRVKTAAFKTIFCGEL